MYMKHGASDRPEYKCWQQIKARCLNPNHKAYPDYGGRGITICDAWKDDFELFWGQVGPRPTPKHSLDRIDNNKGYEPGNVRWATKTEQNRNRRPNRGWSPRDLFEVPSDKVTNFKHGMIGTPEYKTWARMKNRCFNVGGPDYPNYGGRGITVCEEWRSDFMAFFNHVGPRPTPKHSIDRIDNDKGYEPGNVRWATVAEQNLNRRPIVTGDEHGNTKHGKAGPATITPEYKTWTSIKTRCFNEKHDRYATYGGAGITMCEGWKTSFQSFLADVGTKPDPTFTLGRKDPSKSYTCGHCEECVRNKWELNCAWSSKTDQNRNRRPSERSGKLNLEKVAVIRARLAAGVGQVEIANEFQVGVNLIRKIAAGEAWA